ncbi:predicted protein [Sclerotinia sclerotiorum 1980 UF-70]|uniref:Uncharacterized protein n=2 Tax=Sclerotinia sclerotiorum (strain ATCC 18683 / 1980 / Ss-1) TaxID=665079 RepID=A0A1D9Q3X1_SCLS1|nr:predicted protein [Sclerotinia sclerotiorum 1980 UF-70]APA09660.1 hypothetical protein sscle_05g044300 [Sclerotinia sclerotiorum 1980 UF-70]EDO03693.1 predicted protein [Sclerotinia sclerotiorum 1980 UF-70]
MDLKKITTKQLLQQLSAVGIEKPTQKDGLVALLQNHSRFTRHQQQAQDLAAIEQKIIEGPGKADLEMLLHRMMKILLTGLDLTLPQLPRGTEVQMQVSMNVTHTQIEIINADDQNRGGAPPLSEEDRNDMAMSNLAMVDEEEEEGKGLIEKLHPRPRARPENQEPEDRESNTSPIKRKRENSLASSSGSQQPILSKSKVESKAGFTSNEQTFEAFAPKSRSTLVKQPKKKQKRIGGRFVSGRE